VGYEQIGLNMNLPVSSLALSWILERKSLDFKLHNAGVWMGEVGVDSKLSERLYCSLSASGSQKQNVSVTMPQNPFGNFSLPQLAENGLTWSGTQFQYWSIDGNAGIELRSDMVIIGGIRFNKMSMNLRDPADSAGQLPRPGTQFFSDFSSNLWIPYLGIKVVDSYYDFSVIASPLATVSVSVPLTFIVVDVDPASSETSTYKIGHAGWFIEANGNYFRNLTNNLTVSLWGKLNWLNVRGNGTLDHVHYGFSNGVGSDFDSVDGEATYSRYVLGGGVTANLNF
jgi:hypothetical protein